MKIRSLLLGSVAAAGLSTAGFAADLGVVTSLDVCDELGLSGLTISSDDNCLVITGGVSFEYSIGDYAPAVTYVGGATVIDNGGWPDASLDVDAWLSFMAEADSDFGPAQATIKIGVEDYDATGTTNDVQLQEAWVGIGDSTMFMAGIKDSIFNADDDGALDYLGLWSGVGTDDGVEAGGGPTTGGTVMQVVSLVGNGLSVGAGLEALNANAPPTATAVGVIAYAGDGISAHVSGAAGSGPASAWRVHAGFTGTWDPITIVGAFDADSTAAWEAMGSAKATFDIFTLAATGNIDNAGNWGVGGSMGATVTDGVTLNIGGRWFDNGVDTNWQVEGGVSAAVTEAITLTAAVGAIGDTAGNPDAFYGKAGVAWAPGGGFDASVNGEVSSLGGYKATFAASKSIK